ncbi:hypothetical protein LIER_28455 [Lithospermum erythrorhizon]|uniref:G-patch domain-containing protein n=1 Tax=Lithospermum erythrorhizon TaxID=34254 RepID=A0AAV3RJF7_LITER
MDEGRYGEEGGGVALGLGMNFINTNNHIQNTITNSSQIPIASSNIGFQLLKKHGWKEGTGLGVSEQGRLEPIETHVKKNKKGLGAERDKKRGKEKSKSCEKQSNEGTQRASTGVKKKSISKKMRKMLEDEKRMEEKEFEQAFFREFWPDNV